MQLTFPAPLDVSSHSLLEFNLRCRRAALFRTLCRRLFASVLALLCSIETGRAAGQVLAWGDNYFGQTNVPPGLTNVTAVAAGLFHSLALRNDGTVVAWGENSSGQTNVPKRLTNVTVIAAGTTHSLALQKSGAIASWGDNTDGQTTVPGNLVNVIAIAAGHSHSLALQRDGTVVAWGDNTIGQTNVPAGLTNAAAIAAGTSHSLALRNDGTVAAWGANGSGQATVPHGLSDIVAIAAGGGHSLALRSDGTVVAWGSNEEGQTSVPLGLSNVVSIAGGTWTSMALTEDGAVAMWGCCFLPGVQVGISNAVAIGLGHFHALTIVDDGPPVVTVHPFSRSVFSGHELVLRVMAVGRAPLNYQWRWNGTDLPGETNALLRLPAVQSGDGDTYSVVVSNVFGSTTSAPATLTVIQSPPFIITQPTNQDFHLGDSFVLAVQADGSGPLEYQWWFNGAPIAGATNATLPFSNARDDRLGVYTVTIQNSLGSITSHPLQLVLPIKYEFSGPSVPLIWDFSGWYESPLSARIAQNQDGALTYTVYGSPSNYVTYDGHVTTNQGSVGFYIPVIARYTDTVGSGYWWTCGLSVSLKQDKRSLSGFREYAVMVPASLYPWLREYWYPHVVVPGINYFSELVTVPLPGGADGHWHLDLDSASDGARVSGTASIVLSSSNVVPFVVSGTIPTVTKSVMKLRCPSGSSFLEIVALGPERALQSLRGTVSGQPVNDDAPAATNTLSPEILGHGTVAPLTNGQAFVIGKDYTLTARPYPGYLFSNWVVAGQVVANPKLRFTMCSNLTLRANFVPSPFLALKGSYNGLFYDTNAPAHENAGFFTLTLTDKGAFSSRLQQGGAKYSFSGQFDLALSAQKTIPRKGTNEVVAGLQLTGDSDRLLGMVSNVAWSSELFGYRATLNSKSLPATDFVGSYTLLLPGAADPVEGPMGHGFALLGVKSSGSVSFTGTLGDGSAAAQKVPLAANGQWPFYASPYAGKGSVFGWLTLIDSATNNVTGVVLWTKPGGVKGFLHPAGFTNQVETLGARYHAPASGTRVVNFGNAVIVLAGGNLSSALTNAIVLSDRNKVTVDAPNRQKLSLTLTVSSGSFKGSFVHPQTGKPATLKGVLVQKQNLGAGFFLGTNQSGRVFFGEMEGDLQ